MADNFQKIKLTKPQKLWLGAICSKLRTGEQVSARGLKVELRDKLPIDFNPSAIDSRLLRHEDQITLLGIGLLDPNSELVKRADQVIESIRTLLLRYLGTKSIGVDYVSNETKLPKEEVAGIFKELAYLGFFHDSGTNYGYGVDGWLTINIDERAFDAYLKYESIGRILDTIVEGGSDVTYQSAEEKAKVVIQKLENFLQELTIIWAERAIQRQDFDGAVELIQNWKERAAQFLRDNVSEVEARELQRRTRDFPPIRHVGDLDFRIAKYEEILKALIKEIQDDPAILPVTPITARPESAGTQRSNAIDDTQPIGKANLSFAIELYDKVKNLIQNTRPLDENTAREIIELAEDAIREFGSTNQPKKVELRKIMEQVKLSIPPADIEEFRKRAEGQVLRRAYPKSKTVRNALLVSVGAIALVIACIAWLYPLVQKPEVPKAETEANSKDSAQVKEHAASNQLLATPQNPTAPSPILSPQNVSSKPQPSEEQNVTQTQIEMDKAYNAVSQMRIGMRTGLDQLLELKSKSANENVRQRVKVLLDNVIADYERVALERLKDDVQHSAVLEIYSNNVLELQGKPGLVAGLVKVIRTEQELMQVAFAFLALRETTNRHFGMFDIEAVEQWCSSHKADCNK